MANKYHFHTLMVLLNLFLTREQWDFLDVWPGSANTVKFLSNFLTYRLSITFKIFFRLLTSLPFNILHLFLTSFLGKAFLIPIQ